MLSKASTLLRSVRLLGATGLTSEPADVLLLEGRIAAVGPGLAAPAGCAVLEAAGHWLMPAGVDLQAHLGEPGAESKEDLASGLAAAAAGGYADVCATPDTRPCNDEPTVTSTLLARARALPGARLRLIGAATRQLGGHELAELAAMRDAGATAIGDVPGSVARSSVLRHVFEYARGLGFTVFQRPDDAELSAGAVMNEGAVSTVLGLRGTPSVAEAAGLERDLALAAWTGARLHVSAVTTAAAVTKLRIAKAQGLAVSAAVPVHNLLLDETALLGFDPNLRLDPPLRTERDRLALLEGLADGTIDAVVSDHRPQTVLEKDCGFVEAAPGAISLELVLPLLLDLVRAGELDLGVLVAAFAIRPAAVLGLGDRSIREGAVADLVLVAPDLEWTPRHGGLRSKSRNTPFLDRRLLGRPVATWVDGVQVNHRFGD